MKNKIFLGTLFFLIGACTLPVHAKFYSLETENLRLIYYGKAHEYLVKYIARSFENSFAFHEQFFDYQSKEKITVVIHDLNDYGNAGAGTVPRNHITLSIAPPSFVYETIPANERMNSTMNHEVVHIVSNDKASGSDVFFRKLFRGKVVETPDQPLSMIYGYLTTPRRSSPRWYREGMAVFMETWMAGGLGRALGSYDEMVFRALVHEDARIYDLVGLESEGTKIDFQIGANAYLYGTRFMSYLALRHGPERLTQWFARGKGTKKYFADQFGAIYSRSMDEAWAEWIEWEREFQRKNLEAIRKHPVTPFFPISDHAVGSVSRGYYDPNDRKLYIAINYPGQVAHIASIDRDTGVIEKIQNIKGAALYFVTSLAYDAQTRTLFYTTDNNEWRDLRAVDLDTGKSRTLLKDCRIGDLAFCRGDSSIWGVRHFNGVSTVVRVSHPYDDWEMIYKWPYGMDIYDIDISPDGTQLIGALSEPSGRQTLIRMNVEDLLVGGAEYKTLFDFENSVPANFVFTDDGRYLFGSSYYSGVSNIYLYDLEAEDIWIVSNCETGFFRPAPISEDSLIVFRYTTKGFVPGVIPADTLGPVGSVKFLGQEVVEAHPVVSEWIADSPASVDIDSLTTHSGNYHALRHFRLNSVYPIVEGYKEFGAFGLRANFSGPIGLHALDLSASYTPNTRLPSDERWHAKLTYGHIGWKLRATYNIADFYDLFGPTKNSRKGYSVGLEYNRSLLFDAPRTAGLSVGAAYYGDLEITPEYQNVSSTSDKLLTGGINLDYKHLRASLGAVDYETGFKWETGTSANYASERFFPRVYTNFDIGVPLTIDHSSVWLRTSVGNAWGDKDEPFANFFFGGFGNNWVDHQAEKRYREQESFPGVEINEIPGQNYAKAMLEWNLPPIRFRRLGRPSFYNTWARTSVFATGLATDIDSDRFRTFASNIGAQIDLRFVVLSHMKLTFSLGYAFAWREGGVTSDEWMFSLKIL